MRIEPLEMLVQRRDRTERTSIPIGSVDGWPYIIFCVTMVWMTD